MKNILCLFSIILLTCNLSCSQTFSSDKEGKIAANIEFEETVHDYGTIEKGSNGEIKFVFTNKGDSALVLSNVRSSCGCTVPQWPRKPIAKGEQAAIKVRYNTNIVGNFSKSITVYSNSKNSPIVLRIKGTVTNPSAAQSAEKTKK